MSRQYGRWNIYWGTNVDVREPSEEDPKLRNESSSTMDVILEFNFQTVTKWYNSRGNVTREANTPAESRFICVDYTAPDDELKRLLVEELETYGLSSKYTKERLVAAGIIHGRAIGRLREGKLVLVFSIIQNLFYIEDDRIRVDGGTMMVPASNEAIVSLPKKKEDGDEIESCSVCLEELPVGAVVSTLPCSHVFHSDCILIWLNISHYCPICRFEMPIDE
ncbi:E3 ubiquitin-protein ligase ring1-like [Phtheirospermum japonicum]|uniref:RING-type E3 ubiquitin transferase n=1 Tax=Phtheirospermum japonicum TaxID=374723 RepID=A0A830CRN3_9LAMI|nr:E3 ubiquitin-protein ligase ring1-like [Phtheirospermum japonicum]